MNISSLFQSVAHSEEGKARGETSTPKMEEVSIKLFPIYTYPKTTQEIIDFSDVDILGWLTSEIADTFVDTEETDLISGEVTAARKQKASCLILVTPKPIRFAYSFALSDIPVCTPA